MSKWPELGGRHAGIMHVLLSTAGNSSTIYGTTSNAVSTHASLENATRSKVTVVQSYRGLAHQDRNTQLGGGSFSIWRRLPRHSRVWSPDARVAYIQNHGFTKTGAHDRLKAGIPHQSEYMIGMFCFAAALPLRLAECFGTSLSPSSRARRWRPRLDY